jgi:hypothetical protein
MTTRKVCCQGCGADLQIDEGIRFVTCNYCNARLEVVHDATVTHTRLLDQIEKTTRQMAGNLKVIELQNDLERLDREWQIEREGWMVRNKDGSTSEPGAVSSIIGGIIAIGFGIFWIIMTSSVGAPGIFSLFGLVFIGAAIFGMVGASNKASGYNSAVQVYEQRRRSLIQRLESERSGS